MPGCLLGDPFHKYVGFLFYQFRNALAEFTADVVERDIGIFDRIVQKSLMKHVLIPSLAPYLIYDNYASIYYDGGESHSTTLTQIPAGLELTVTEVTRAAADGKGETE